MVVARVRVARAALVARAVLVVQEHEADGEADEDAELHADRQRLVEERVRGLRRSRCRSRGGYLCLKCTAPVFAVSAVTLRANATRTEIGVDRLYSLTLVCSHHCSDAMLSLSL